MKSKHLVLLVAVLALVFAFGGCKKKEASTSAPGVSEETGNKLKENEAMKKKKLDEAGDMEKDKAAEGKGGK